MTPYSPLLSNYPHLYWSIQNIWNIIASPCVKASTIFIYGGSFEWQPYLWFYWGSWWHQIRDIMEGFEVSWWKSTRQGNRGSCSRWRMFWDVWLITWLRFVAESTAESTCCDKLVGAKNLKDDCEGSERVWPHILPREITGVKTSGTSEKALSLNAAISYIYQLYTCIASASSPGDQFWESFSSSLLVKAYFWRWRSISEKCI